MLWQHPLAAPMIFRGRADDFSWPRPNAGAHYARYCARTDRKAFRLHYGCQASIRERTSTSLISPCREGHHIAVPKPCRKIATSNRLLGGSREAGSGETSGNATTFPQIYRPNCSR
jgi:hypothetical protein